MDSFCVAFLLPRDQSLTSWLSDAILSKSESKIAKLLGHGFSAARLVHYFADYQYAENYINHFKIYNY